MTIERLLVGACIAVPFGMAFEAARTAKANIGEYLLAMLVASAIGVSFAFPMRVMHRRLVDTFEHSSPTTFRAFSVAVFIAECVWIGAAGFAVSWATALLFLRVH